MGGTSHLLETGQAALISGDWRGARTAFEEAVATEATPDALLGLGNAHWWLGDTRQAVASWERAYAGFVKQDDPVQAVTAAVNLSIVYEANFGNRAVAAGWAARAERLCQPLGVPALDAWVLLARAGTSEDPDQIERWADEAYAVAIEAGDRDLELCALSIKGSALVEGGRVDAGVALLDEALAGALGGEVESLDTVVFTSCTLMKSCVRCADFSRVLQWGQALAPFTDRYGCPYVMATCRARYGAVLVATGDWGRAEVELGAALELAGDALPAVRAEALAFLAELRLGQGRVEEARGIVADLEDHPMVLPVLAATCLAGGEAKVAAAVASRRLRAAGSRRLEEARLREVLGDAALADGDADTAAAHGRELVEVGARTGCELIAARGERLLGRALAHAEPGRAQAHLEAARALFARLEMPLEVARCRMATAVALHDAEAEVAVAEARGALRVFEDLGAARDADAAAAWLREAGATVARAGPRGGRTLTKREGDVLVLVGDGLSNPEIAERLYISRRTVEHHVASILSKLGLRNRAEAAAYAARHGGEELAAK